MFCVLRVNIRFCVVSLVLTYWLYADIYCRVHLFIQYIIIYLLTIYLCLYTLYIDYCIYMHAIYLIAIYNQTLAHVTTVICWLYPTLKFFYLILIFCLILSFKYNRQWIICVEADCLVVKHLDIQWLIGMVGISSIAVLWQCARICFSDV